MSDVRSTLDEFRDIQEYYPGSTRPIIRHPNRDVDRRFDRPEWDDKPLKLKVGGKEMEFFTVGQLGDALGGRRPVTIRKWERTGVIPKPTFRKPSEDPRGQRRLYSRAQVEGMIRIAEEEGVLYPYSRPIKESEFTAKVIELFKELQAQESL